MRYLFFVLLLLSQGVLAQSTIDITVDSIRFRVDTTNQLILCQVNLARYTTFGDSTRVQLVVGDATYPVVEKQVGLSYLNSYPVQKEDSVYRLFFTQLPVISIHSQDSIVDLKKVNAQFMYVADDQVLTSTIGIETRGGSSQYFPKKTFDIGLRKDTTTEESRDLQFGKLRDDDDWILDALYNEPIRIRSFMAHKLWLAMHQPTYQDKELEAKAGADVMWVEVFLQDTYRGIYALSEQVDRKLLKLKKFKEGEIRGELFKTEHWSDAVLLRKAPPYDTTARDWEFYQMKYPDKEDTTDWTSLHRFVSFVVNADSASFTDSINSLFDLSNAVDYFIWLNILRAIDNYGKNIYVARYTKDSPYFYVPWDLDATWGQRWDGLEEDITNNILRNGLYLRLVQWNAQEFNERAIQRWYELRRGGVLSDEAITHLIDETHATLLDNNIYEREQIVWKEYTYDSASIAYLKSWTERRLAYLDEYFYDPVLSTENPTEKEAVVLYPNPAYSTLTVKTTHHRPMPYQLINIHGAVVQSGTIRPDDPTIEVAGLRRGYYIFRAHDIAERVLIAD